MSQNKVFDKGMYAERLFSLSFFRHVWSKGKSESLRQQPTCLLAISIDKVGEHARLLQGSQARRGDLLTEIAAEYRTSAIALFIRVLVSEGFLFCLFRNSAGIPRESGL